MLSSKNKASITQKGAHSTLPLFCYLKLFLVHSAKTFGNSGITGVYPTYRLHLAKQTPKSLPYNLVVNLLALADYYLAVDRDLSVRILNDNVVDCNALTRDKCSCLALGINELGS